MRKNLVQSGEISADGRRMIEGDWFAGGIPANVVLAENVYIDTSYGFSAFHSTKKNALLMGEATGCYDRTNFIVGTEGSLKVGNFTILNGTTLICNQNIDIGNHCMLAWGSVITDSWVIGGGFNLKKRAQILKKAAQDKQRKMPFYSKPAPIVIEDNVWVGFDTVIMGGVRLGRGSVIGSRTVISEDIPPYALVVGNPPRIIRFLEPNDTEEAIKEAFIKHSKK